MIPIPVIDLFDGQAVHAVRGLRESYRPLMSALAPTSSARDVVAGYLKLYPFRHCYIADLNALRAFGDSNHEIAALLAQHQNLEFWIDGGFGSREHLPTYLASPNARGIIGSESIGDLADYDRLRASLAQYLEPVLSLDFKGGQFLGPRELRDAPNRWPQRIIVMNLDRVGSGEGPDLDLLRQLHTSAPHCAFAAAGGIRHEQDLLHLRDLPASFVLLATALHDRRIGAAALARLEESRSSIARRPT